MSQKREAHPAHSQEEYIVAAIAGFGLLLAMAAGLFNAFGSREELLGLSLTQVAYIGLFFIAAGLALWLVLLRPWEQFDDLQTPYYTGHDHHHGEAEAGKEVEEAVAEVGMEVEEAVAEVAEAEPKVEAPAVVVDAAESQVDPDNLKVIEGIGPKVQAALYDAGIVTYGQMASMSGDELTRIVKDEHGVRIVGDAATWPKQAQYLVKGDADGLKAYQDKLVAGREPEDS